ncbi:unnamed protein product [Kuraishia capsulata CBS 1993]|uniref:Uncharacterized protein n=1 Tax=Kuraishia capsulata CBS 1993 TaxID=1382522 RepID=W6MHQ8_9ASCO|nr:uncharacterized protein KUCA_T00001825001 [Kuraishia capsulata CBS 1993]CDK25854.1 unnamed protein product [Kuraishia capsulata CBS 1993]
MLEDEGQCKLLGPFALIVQSLMGLLSLSALIFKRYKEYPNRRPWKVWFFDVSKQVFGAAGIHTLNVLMSIVGGQSDDWAVGRFELSKEGKTSPYYFHANADADNPCDYYFLNILFDTTLGIPILWVLLTCIYGLARRAEISGIESGVYGSPPKYSWYCKQLVLYFVGLISMKLLIYILLMVCPLLVTFAGWLLSWSDPFPRLQVAFVVLVFPLVMNTFQYYVVDNIIQSPEYHIHKSTADADGLPK